MGRRIDRPELDHTHGEKQVEERASRNRDSSFLEICGRFELVVIDHRNPDHKVDNGFVVCIDAAR